MNHADTFARLDRTIHEKGRLAIMSVLAAVETLSFTELKDQLGMTDGNLLLHLRTLEEHGYVAATRHQVKRKTRTEYALTEPGRTAFREYLQALEEIVRLAQPHTAPAAKPGASLIPPRPLPAK